jgi:hypothetical protein
VCRPHGDLHAGGCVRHPSGKVASHKPKLVTAVGNSVRSIDIDLADLLALMTREDSKAQARRSSELLHDFYELEKVVPKTFATVTEHDLSRCKNLSTSSWRT